MGATVGINLPWNNNQASNGNSNGRLDALASEGYVLLRGAQNTSSSDVQYIWNRERCYVFPMTEGTGFQAYANSFFTAAGQPVAGFCGVLEILNEVWGTWANSTLANGGGAAYWNAISGDVIALKAKWGDKLKLLLCSQPPGTPNGASTPHTSTWLADVVARAQSQGHDIGNLIYGVAWHGYARGQNVLLKSGANYVSPSHPWALKQFDDFFKSKGFGWKVWNTECGAGMFGTDIDAAFSTASQQTWYQNAVAVAQNPNTYIPGLTAGLYEVLAPYCLFMESHTGHDSGAFGIIEHGSWNSGTSTTTSRHPAADVLKTASTNAKAAGATGNFNGTVAPPQPTAPTVSTSAPAGVTTAGATLGASVNPNQLSTTVVFDEGPTTAYGNHLAGGTVPAGTSSVNVTAALSAVLTAGQTRHVRASATNSAGTTVGQDVAYTVPTGAQPLQIKAVLNPSDHSQFLIQNVDPTVVQVRVAWTPLNDTNNATIVNYSAPFPPAVASPDPTKLWGNDSGYDQAGAPVGVWWDQAPGGGRVLTTLTSAVAPTVTTVAATQITAGGAALGGTGDLKGQASGTATIQVGATTSYGTTLGPVTVTGSGSTGGTVSFDAVNPGSTASGASITIPATGANGSFQLAIIGAKGTGATGPNVTPPTVTPAWTSFLGRGFQNTGLGAHALRVFSKIAASEGSGVWGFDQTQPQAGIILALAGVAATSSVRSADSQANPSSNTCTCPSVTAVTGDWLVYGGFFTNGDTVTFPSGTARQTVTTTTTATGTTLFVATEPILVDGLTGVRQIQLNNTYANGADTSCGFSVVVSPSQSVAGVPFSIPVTGVPASTLRHYKAFVTTAGGTGSGSDMTFTTLSAGSSLPGVTWNTPTCVSAQGVTFSGNVDWGSASTVWKFQYRKAGDTNWTDGPGGTASATGPVSGTKSPGLSFGTLYEARLVATNSAGTTTGATQTFVTKDSGHHKFNVGDTVLVLDVSTPGAPDYLLGTQGLVDVATTSLITASFPTGDVVAFAPWALRLP